MAKATKITKPTFYRNYILVPRADGSMDMIDPSNGCWATFPTQRYAKWSATFLKNINERFTDANRMSYGQLDAVKYQAKQGEPA